jgi:6-phosphofructo-2-kinase/fructose-2,6-biphosphatase 4
MLIQLQTLFLESFVDDERILQENARSVKISSPDVRQPHQGTDTILNPVQFVGMDPNDAAKLYLKRINEKIPYFETMDESDLNYVRMINAGRKLTLNNVSFGYISHRIVFYLMNLHIKTRQTFFARAGISSQEDSFKADAPLSPAGYEYAEKMSQALLKHREEERQAMIAATGQDIPLKPLAVWTSTRKRTIQTSEHLASLGYSVRQRSQMSQLNPGVCEKMSEKRIRKEYPEEVEKHELDPYHHRYPRAEVSHPFSILVPQVDISIVLP